MAERTAVRVECTRHQANNASKSLPAKETAARTAPQNPAQESPRKHPMSDIVKQIRNARRAGGPVLGPFDLHSEAIAADREWLAVNRGL